MAQLNAARWHESGDPGRLISLASARVSDRKYRLCVSAALGRVRDQFSTNVCRRAADLVEVIAAGEMTAFEAEPVRSVILNDMLGAPPHVVRPGTPADEAVAWGLYPRGEEAARRALWAVVLALRPPVSSTEAWEQFRADTQREQADLVRCILGNPFRPVAFDPSWRTSTAIALATGVYADRAFDRLPILADALEEAGCDHPGILAHRCGPGPHARGCWVVDLILGKV